MPSLRKSRRLGQPVRGTQEPAKLGQPLLGLSGKVRLDQEQVETLLE
jgi:hypothetical protein